MWLFLFVYNRFVEMVCKQGYPGGQISTQDNFAAAVDGTVQIVVSSQQALF